MSDLSQHAPPPTGRGVYWAVNVDWKSPVLLGMLLLIAALAALAPFLFIVNHDQIKSFAAAVAILDGRELREPLEQRHAILSKQDGVFFWRAIIWEKQGEEYLPRIFHAKVDKKKGFQVIESNVVAYDRDTARRLDLYQDVDRHRE